MKKYYIGLAVIAIAVLSITGVVMTGAISAKQDKVTERRGREIAKELNDYISKNRKIPESLNDAGIKDVPDTIRYDKKSDSTYEFCATYKQSNESDINGFDSLLSGSALRTGSSPELSTYYNDYNSPSLYLSYYHKSGENCQTVEPYLRAPRSNLYDDYYNYQTPSQTSSSLGSSARDTERQTDIKALHGQIEAYYAQNGKYPTLANLNDKTFRSTNLKGLSDSALKDPSSLSAYISSSPAKNIYSYKVTSTSGGVCNNTSVSCAKYTLTATLEGGGTYTKQNLN